MENQMGPNAVWLAEALAEAMDLRPGMRVLDMGCGKAISSIFLAKEFALQVWATDLWIKPGENWERIKAAGMAERVFPIYSEARSLPYADGFFDALVSLDSYHYYGTDDLYMEKYFARLVKPGGQIGIVVPGLVEEIEGDLPAHLAPHWEHDFYSFHSPTWWRRHWEHSGMVRVERADLVPDGWKHWLEWNEACEARGYHGSQKDSDMLRADAGRTLGFPCIVARRS